jgi:DNA-binding response OmpR family regulator
MYTQGSAAVSPPLHRTHACLTRRTPDAPTRRRTLPKKELPPTHFTSPMRGAREARPAVLGTVFISPENSVPMKPKILIVDDDNLYRSATAYNLTDAGFTIFEAQSAEAALDLVHQVRPDLVLLDIGLPGMDGLEALRHLRQHIRVVLHSARLRELDELLGLELGADDYVPKQASHEILVARIRATLRRRPDAAPPPVGGEVLHLGRLEVNTGAHTVTLADQPIHLSPTEFRLLAALAAQAGQVVSVDALLNQVWGEGYVGEPQNVYVCIRALREKLEPDPYHPIYIQTVRGVGYRLVAKL